MTLTEIQLSNPFVIIYHECPGQCDLLPSENMCYLLAGSSQLNWEHRVIKCGDFEKKMTHFLLSKSLSVLTLVPIRSLAECGTWSPFLSAESVFILDSSADKIKLIISLSGNKVKNSMAVFKDGICQWAACSINAFWGVLVVWNSNDIWIYFLSELKFNVG